MDGNQASGIVGKLDASLSNWMEVFEEVHSQDVVDGRNDQADDDDNNNSLTKVQRARYAI